MFTLNRYSRLYETHPHPSCHSRIVSALQSRREQEHEDQDHTFLKADTHPGEPMGHCYRTLLKASNSAILFLSSESIILGWNRAAETSSGWIADEVLGRSYAELCVPMKMRESFLTELARVTEGSEVRGLELPLRTRTGSETCSPGISRGCWDSRTSDRPHGHRDCRLPEYRCWKKNSGWPMPKYAARLAGRREP